MTLNSLEAQVNLPGKEYLIMPLSQAAWQAKLGEGDGADVLRYIRAYTGRNTALLGMRFLTSGHREVGK